MTGVIVMYVPGAGGNHVKNLLCASPAVANGHELDESFYDRWDPANHAPGEVNCVGGRNIQPCFLERMQQSPDQIWVMPAHFGELAQYRSQLPDIAGCSVILITILHEDSRRQLMERQTRLGQHIHPYWLDEEIVHLYHADMLQGYFGFDPHQIFAVEMRDCWQRNWVDTQQFQDLGSFLHIPIPRDHCHRLHTKWWDLNFDHWAAQARISQEQHGLTPG